MRIIGFSVNKILAERKTPSQGRIEIKSNINIKDIVKEDINISNSPALKFDFEFTIDYSPKTAIVEIFGSVVVIDDKNESAEILKDWKKKEFKHPMKVTLFNFIMDKCNLKALQVEEDLSLPLHIPLPKIRAEQSNSNNNNNSANYTG